MRPCRLFRWRILVGFLVCGVVAAWMTPADVAIAAEDDVAENLGFRVPDGFEVSLYADDDLAHDIYSMTVDSHGRVVVAGRGYVKILHDDDRDGTADRATLFSDRPKSGAHGMYFDGDDLLCSGDDALMKLRDSDGDGVADGEPEIWSRLRSPEHGANGIVKGPDGWIYVACGNDAGVSEKHASTPYSPVKKPQCGAIVRFSPDGKKSEIFAHGFRNPYDLDFNEHGHLFTVDADGERDQYLPWYAPNRLFDVAQGMHHGWVLKGWSRSWNRPAYFYDSVERLVEIGRGSPTGLVVYRHRQFPEHYRGGVFSACWTLGRVYYFPLTPKGSSYESKTEIFMETTGQIGFAPVDLAVGPEGDLFVAIGGRGTRGSVFRVRYAKAKPIEQPKEEILQVLDADQPLASWSRAKWLPKARNVDAQRFDAVITDDFGDAARRIRCVQIREELGGEPTSEAMRSLGGREDPLLRATAARMLCTRNRRFADQIDKAAQGRRDRGFRFGSTLKLLVFDSHPLVRRHAWDVNRFWMSHLASRWSTQACDEVDRRSRDAAMSLCVELPLGKEMGRPSPDPDNETEEELQSRLVSEFSELAESTLSFARDSEGERRQQLAYRSAGQMRVALANPSVKPQPNTDILFDIFAFTSDANLRVECLRLVQLACGDVRTTEQQPDFYAGYAPANEDKLPGESKRRIVAHVLKTFPTESRIENFEIARLLGMLATDDASAVLKTLLCISSKSSPSDDIHFLIVASRLPGERDAATTALTSVALVDLHYKMAARKWEPSRNWPLVVGELFEELCKRDPALADTLVARPQFELPEHSLFATRMKGETRRVAARKLLQFAKNADDDVRWTSEMVDVVAELPADEVLPVLRERFDEDFGLRDSIVLVLAKNPSEDDRGRLVWALSSPQGSVVHMAAAALAKLSAPGTPDEISAALSTLRSYTAEDRGDRKRFAVVRQTLDGLARHWSGEKIEIDEGADGKTLAETYRPWFEWFTRTHPEAAKKLAQSPGVDAAAWAKRLAGIDWNAGDAARGKIVFERRSCHRCHGATGRLGPDLAGAASRFSREDLLAAIYDPNRDVSPLYQTTQITTRGGQTHFGLLVYESPEGTLLQTGPDTTIRVTDEDYGARRASRMSLMPTGLLDGVSDAEIADLYEHMRSLDGRRPD